MTLPATLRMVSNEIVNNRKIEAIKLLKAARNLPLKDAKDIIDEAYAIADGSPVITIVDNALEEALRRFDNDDLELLPSSSTQRTIDVGTEQRVTNNLLRRLIALLQENMKENNELIRDWIDTQS